MVDQILIAGLSGLLIIAIVHGLAVFSKIIKMKNQSSITLIESVKQSKLGALSWVTLTIFVLFLAMIIFGIGASAILG